MSKVRAKAGLTAVRNKLLRRLLHSPSALTGFVVLTTLTFAALFAPLLATTSPTKQDLGAALIGPTPDHPLGTDELGRDIYSRLLYGARISLGLSSLTVLMSAFLGSMLGIVAAYYGSWVEEVFMRLTDVLLAFPGILLAITIVGVLGTGLQNVLFAIGVYLVPEFIRLARSAALAVKQNDYVESARALGANDLRLMWAHISPNVISPLIVQATLRIGTVILLTSGLSFLGLGPKPPTPEWGLMLSTGKDYLRIAPHISVFPGAAIMLAVLGFNLLGDAMRDVLDPHRGGSL